MSFLHHAVKDQNEQVIKMLKDELMYFDQIVDDNTNEDEITPLF